MKPELYSLSQDLLGLYCKTKNAKVEDLYLKITAQTKTEADKFVSVMKSDKWRGGYKQLRTGKEGEVIRKVLEWIAENRKSKDLSRVYQEAYALFSGDKQILMEIIPTIDSLANTRFKSLLYPYTGVLKEYMSQLQGALKGAGGIKTDRTDVINDITLMNNWFNAEKDDEAISPQEMQQRQKMYSMLLRKFSEDVVNAFQNAIATVGQNTPQGQQYMKITQAIRSGALTDANKFNGLINLPINQTMFGKASKIVSSIFANSADPFFGQNYELIKKDALAFVGAKPKPSPYRPEEDEQTGVTKTPSMVQQIKQDPSKSLIPPFSKTKEGELPTSVVPSEKEIEQDLQRRKTRIVPDEDLMYPPVIAMLCIIFYTMQRKIYGDD